MPNPFAAHAFKSVPGQVGSAWRLWSLFKTLRVQDIADAAEAPFHLALIGTEERTHLLAARLARDAAPPALGLTGPADIRAHVGHYRRAEAAPAGSLILEADASTASETNLAAALAQITRTNPDLALSLARHVPAFRPAAVARLIAEASKENARIALLSALPGVLPVTGFLLPAAAVGDTLLLTQNQGRLLLRIAAAYGRDVDLRGRARELLPVVGGAFGWRAAARELVGLVPGGVGLLMKGSIAYAGTYTVGRAAAAYYGTGQTLTGPRLRRLFQDALRDAAGHARPLLRRGG